MVSYGQYRRGGATHRRAVEGADRSLAVLAHASIGFGFVGIGFLLGLAINGVIWLRSRRSSYVSVQAEQAGAYQLAVVLINVALALVLVPTAIYVVFAESSVGAGQLSTPQVVAGLWCALLPLVAGWYVGSILLGLYGALKIARGGEFWYPIFGDWARRRAKTA